MVAFDGEKSRDPWRFPLMGTLTGFSETFVRCRHPDGSTTARMLRGVELMRAIGWDLEDFVNVGELLQSEAGTDKTLSSLVGNAFSGYAVGPVIAAAVASMGVAASQLDTEPEDDGAISVSESDSDRVATPWAL